MKLSKIYSENRLLILLVSILIILIGLPIVVLLMINKTITAAAWYDTNWEHRKPITVSNDTGSTLSNEDVLVTVDTESLINNGKLQNDCDDLRFVDSDDSTPIDYWIEGGCNTSTTEVWVQIPSLPSGGKTIYMYYANDSATSGELSWSGNFIIMTDQGSCPTGWSRVTALDSRFLRGSSSYGSTGGSSTHTHTYTQIGEHSHGAGSYVTTTNGSHTHSLWFIKPGSTRWDSAYIRHLDQGHSWQSGGVNSNGAHSHSISGTTSSTGSASGTTDSTSSLPPYYNLLFCSPDSLGDMPQSSILLFETLPGTGYTRFTDLDSKFPRAFTSAGGTGGSSTHTHTYSDVISHSHGDGSLTTATAGSHTHSLLVAQTSGSEGSHRYVRTRGGDDGTNKWGTVSTAGAHSHSITGSSASAGTASATTDSANTLPPYMDMVFGSTSSSQASFVSGTISITTANPPLGWDRYTSLDDKFVRGAESSGGTGGATTHSHSYTDVPAHTHGGGTLSTNTAGAHNHSLDNGSGSYVVTGWAHMTGYANGWYSGYVSNSGSHSHTVSGTTATAGTSGTMTTSTDSNVPPYIEVIYSQRADSQTTTLGAEESQVPDAPTAESATPTSTSEITWNFTDNSDNETGFKVYDTSDVLKVTCATPNISSCLEGSLSENTQYTRKFLAYNDAGNGDFSDTTSAYTKASTVSILDSTSTVDSITLESTAFTNPTVESSGYYFDCTDDSCDTGINEWIQTETDTATSLANNTGYNFRVKNRNGDGVENSYSAEQELWTKADIPTITNTDITDTTITLQAQGVNNYSQGSSGFYFDCIAGTGCDSGINEWVATDTDTVVGLDSDTQYSFKVKARNYDGVETEYSTTSLDIYTHSTQPTISSVDSATTSSLDLNIDNEENPATTTYVVEEVNTAKYVNSSGQLQIDPVWLTYEQLGSENGITITGLNSNTEYTFRVKAKNQADVETNYSEPVSEYTQLQAPTLLDPETKTDTSITWEITTTETGYDGIKMYDTEGNLVNTCVGLNITECQETGLDPNTQYSRTATIYNTNSESVDSSTVSEYTNAQPISISLSSPINYYEISLSINLEDNPVGTDLEIYEINTEKYFNSNLGILVEDQTDFESTSESVTVSGLSPNTNYQFKVRAIDEEGNSTTWSDPSTVRTYAQVPNIVSATALSTTSGRLTIDLGDNPEGTRISIFESSNRYLKESGKFSDTEQIFDLEGDSIDITGLTSNTTYTFKVRAYNEDNVETDWSSTVDLITLINQPTLEVSEKTKNSVTLEISGLNNISQESSGTYIERIGEWSKESVQRVTGLKPNTRYIFKVKAKNGNGKETTYKESAPTYTLAEIPSISSTSANSATQGVLNIDLGNNPENTRISIKETTTNKYLSSDGSLSDTETVLDTEDTQFNISELEANTVYRFKIKAHNEEDIATQYSSSEFTLTTLCGQPTVSIDNITNSSANINISDVNNITVGDSGILVERLDTWSQDTTQTVDELNPNTSYTFRVKVRNQQGRETTFVSSDSITTLANRPEIESVIKISANSARVYLDTNDNSSNTQYAIRDRISEMYVNQAGTLQEDPVWQTYTQWGSSIGKYVTGLEGLRQVGFEVRARNSNGVRTSFSQAEYIGTGSVIKNAPSTVAIRLKDDEDVDVSSDAQLGIQDVRIRKDKYMVADLKVSFEEDRDWSDAVADADFENSKAVVKIKDNHGVTDPFTMYVVRNDTNAFRICPQADSLDDLKEGCEGEQLLTGSFPQEIDIEGTIVTISEAKIDGTYYWIADGLTGTGGMGETVETTQDATEEKEDEEEKVIQKIGKRISDTASNVSKSVVLGTVEVFDNTRIGELNEGELSTAVATTTTVTITVGIATTGVMQSFYLFFHFINGVLNALGFVRKRKPFGYVYDSNSKEPISNAVVRIYKGDKLVDTTVTNSQGMFLSNLSEGKYKIKVKKSGYDFPTKLIKGSEDYPLKNIYKGDIIKKGKSSDVIVNIPLDKKELKKTKKFITILKSTGSIILTFINILLFTFGILLVVYTYYKYPNLFRWYIPLLYIPALYFLAKSIFGKTVVYGKVVDKKGKPMKDRELFLVNKEFDEVVAKRVTDEKGRYRFVCNRGLYELRMGKKTLFDNIDVKRDGYVLNKRIKYKE
jgi:hypothetical protein